MNFDFSETCRKMPICILKRYCNENNPTLKVAKHNKYKNARNVIIFKVKKSKKEYYQNYFQKHSKNVKKNWDGIKSIVTLKFKDKTTPNLLMVNGNVIINKNCIAEIFNGFLLMLVQILRLKYRKENDLLKYI